MTTGSPRGIPSDNEQFDVKIDHRFSEKNLLSAKYSQDWNHYNRLQVLPELHRPCGGGINQGNAHLFALSDTYTINPTLLLTTP